MRLSEQEYYQYLNLHQRLIHFVGQKKKLLPSSFSFEAFLDSTGEEKLPVRDALYENIGLIDNYIKEYAKSLSEEDIEILQGFKHFKKEQFYVMKLTKKEALFMGKDYVYSVLALSDPFSFFWHTSDLPTMVDAVLLPFKGKIIFDGIFLGYSISFGKGLRSSLNNDFNLAKSRYGVINQLPISNEIKNQKTDLKKTLAALMKTKASRDHNWYEIETLLDENIKLYPFYYQEWGRINSRKKKKELKLMGIKNYHFAICEDVVVASAKSLAEVKKNVQNMISSKNTLDSIFYFKV